MSDQQAIILNASGLARLLGISVRAIRTHDACGKIPQAIKLGRLKRWRRAEIEAWIAEGMPAREEWARLWRDLRRAEKARRG